MNKSKDDLITLIDDGNISYEDALEMVREMDKKRTLSTYKFPEKKSSDGYYHIYVADPSKKSGRRQIKDKTLSGLREKVYDFEKGVFGSSTKTFKTCFDICQQEKLKYVKDAEKKLSVQNTVHRIDMDYQRYFKDTDFENLAIDGITKRDIEQVCYLNLKRYDLKEKAFLALRGIIKSVFGLAISEYWIDDNVYERVNFKKFNDMLVRPVDIEERVHSEEEVNRILDYLSEEEHNKKRPLTVLSLRLQIVMGLRRGEVPALKWSDIKDDYILIQREQITVHKSKLNPKQYDKLVEHTKTYVNRSYPITTEIRNILERIRKVHEVNGISSIFLFPSVRDERIPMSNTAIYDYYYRMCQKLNIKTCKEITKGTHSFRRNGITNVINRSNGNILLASQLYGNNPNTAYRNYFTGLDLDAAKIVLEKIH